MTNPQNISIFNPIYDHQPQKNLFRHPSGEADSSGSIASSSSVEVLPSSSAEFSSASVEQSSSSLLDSSSSGGTTPSSSSSLTPSSSSKAVVVTNGCKASNPKAGFTCGWNVKGTLLPGVNIKPESTGGDGCTIAWSYKDDESPFANCYAATATGITSKGGAVYTLFAKLTCSDGEHTTACDPTSGLSSKAAPSLAGTCKWSKNPTTSAIGTEPTGITLRLGDNEFGTLCLTAQSET